MSDPINDTEKKPTTNNNTHNQTKKSPFNALTPTCDADKDGHYREMLDWALRNDKDNDIRNIALTGPYGSGKSSIIKTFEKKNANKKLVFLNISLATFNEENDDNEVGSKEKENSNPTNSKESVLTSKVKYIRNIRVEKNKEKQLRLIEYSILQQIFYHETDSKIPDSRFRKIQSLSEHDEYFTKLGIFVFVVALLYELFSNHFWGMLRIHPVKSMDITFHILALGAMLYLGSIFIKKTIRPLRSVQFKKFNIQQAEFAVDDNISKSILNEHLDEILYFFEVTDYTVVVFEDLDRFDRPEIFTKLRELNHLINYSKKIERKVVFIYAVRDDMFFDKERTKFFDFIVPVIPVISSANSSSRLLNIVEENDYKINNDLLEDISFFVDDMRLIYNIMNEYYIYRKNFGDLDQNLLLGLIVYKNIYPNDFVNLNKSEGVLYAVLQKKEHYLKMEAQSINEQLSSLRKELKEIESLQYSTVKQLRERYIMEILRSIDSLVTITIAGEDTPIGELTSDKNFDSIRNGKLGYYPITATSSSLFSYNKGSHQRINFKDFEKGIDASEDYDVKEKAVLKALSTDVEDIKRLIEDLEQKQAQLAHIKLKSLIENKIEGIKFVDDKQQQFIYIMIRGGYIDENYENYISIFYEGAITKEDDSFRFKVRSGWRTEFDHPLNRIGNLIPKIRDHEFEQQNILNYNLVDYLLEQQRYHVQLKQIMKMIANESTRSIQFIDGFITNGKNVKRFLNSLVGNWTDLWNFISTRSEFTDEKIHNYFQILMTHLEIPNIKKMADKSDLLRFIEVKTDFFDISTDKEKLKTVVNSLGVRFVELDFQNLPEETIRFIYEGNHYELNPFMIKGILYLILNLNTSDFENENKFYSKNYTFIKHQKAPKLIAYIEENINEYIEKTWQGLMVENTQEEEEYQLLLLNNDRITFNNRIFITHQTKTKITNLEKVLDKGLQQEVLIAKRLVANWDNLLYYFNGIGKKIDETLFNFISYDENINVLINNRLDKTNQKHEISDVLKFVEAIYMENSFSNEIYEKLVNSITFDLDTRRKLNNLDVDKIKLLMKKDKLRITQRNFNELKDFPGDLHIKLVEQKTNELINALDKFDYTTRDATLMLNSKKFTNHQKEDIVRHLDDDLVLSDPNLVGTIAMLIFNVKLFSVSKNILKHILTKVDMPEIVPTVLIYNFLSFSPSEVKSIIQKWPEPYSHLFVENIVVSLKNNTENKATANYLLENKLILKIEEEKERILITTLLSDWK